MLCKNCGNEINNTSKHCNRCGYELNKGKHNKLSNVVILLITIAIVRGISDSDVLNWTSS